MELGEPIYMSPDGDDATADGTMENPFANFACTCVMHTGTTILMEVRR